MVNLGELVFSIIAEDRASATVGDAAARIGQAGIVVGAGITAVGAAATGLIDANRQMDASFRATALSMGVPAEAIKELGRSLQSVDSPIEEVAATLDLLGRAGMSNVDALGATASAFDTLADATGQPADTLTNAMIPAFNALGIELEKAPAYVDGLAVMFRKSNVDLDDFSRVMTRIGPDLGRMGIGLNEVSAVMMSFADRGITGRQATTELDQAITAADGDISKFYASIGMTAGELDGYKSELTGSAGAAQEFADAQNSAFGTMDKLGFAFTKIRQTAGDLLAPLEGVAAACLGLGPAVMGASSAMTLLNNEAVTKMIPGLGKVVTGITGAGGLVPALMAIAPPVLVAVAALAAIGAAVYLLDQKFHFIGPTIDWFMNALKGIGDWLGSTFGPIIDGIIGYLDELAASFGGSGSFIQDAINWFGQLGQTIMEFGGYIGSILTPAIQAVAGLIGDFLKAKINDAIIVFTFLANIIQTYVIPALQWLWDGLSKLAGIAASVAAGPLGALAQAFGLTGNSATEATPKVTGAGSAIQTAGSQAGGATPQIGGLGSGFSTLGGAAGSASNPIATAANNIKGAGSAASGAAGGINSASGAFNGMAGAANNAAGAARTAEAAYRSWYNYGVSHNPPMASAAPLSPTSSNGSTGTGAIGDGGKYKYDEAAAKRSEGGVSGTGITVKRQYTEGGYWWTEFSNGTKKKGAAVQVAPGAAKKKHTGGIYQAPGGAAEGLATLLSGERVLSRSQTADYDGGLLGAVRALAAKIDQLGGGSGGGDVIVHGDVKLSEDYSYDHFREDVGRWKSSRIAKGVL